MSTTQAPPRFVRPASQEIRYVSKADLNAGAAFYKEILGVTPSAQDDSAYSFALGVAGRPPTSELRLVLGPAETHPGLMDKPFTYWELADGSKADIKSVYNALVSDGYTPHLKVFTSGKVKISSGIYANTQRGVLADKSGNLLGIIINPPYPTYTSFAGSRSGYLHRQLTTATALQWATLGAVVLGLLIGGVFLHRSWKKLSSHLGIK